MTPKKRKHLKPGDSAVLTLPLAQVDLIVEQVHLSEHLLSIIYSAKVRDDVVRIKCSLDDLDQLSTCVEKEAINMIDIKLRESIGIIFEVIINIEQSYYGAKLRVVPNGLSFNIKDITGQ